MATSTPNGGLVDKVISGTSLTYYATKERCEIAAHKDFEERFSETWQYPVSYQYACTPHLEKYAIGVHDVPEGETWQVPEQFPPIPERKPVR